MATLYEVLDDFCRNKKSGKIMPHKNWPKSNTKIHRSVNHDPDETSPEIIEVRYNDKKIMSTYQDGRIVLHSKYKTKMVRQRINEFLNQSDTGWTIGGYYGPWYMCYHGQKVAAFEDGITIEPAPKKDWSKAKKGDIAVCFYCNCEITVTERLGTDRIYWVVTDPSDEQSGDQSLCKTGWHHRHGMWHYPEFMENDQTGHGASNTMWEEAPDGNYSMGDVSMCVHCNQEVTLQPYDRKHALWTAYGEAWCGRAPTTFHPAGESTWHRPNGKVLRSNGQQEQFPPPIKKPQPKKTWEP